LKQKWFYSEETHNILNHFTLEIKDKEIATEYELYRIKRFNGLFWPLFCVFVMYNVFGWVNYFFGGGELGEALRPLQQWLVIIIMLIPRTFFPRYTPYSWFFCSLPTHVVLHLSMRGYFPGQDSPRLLAQYDLLPIVILVFHIVGNVNTFKLTIMLLPATHIIFYYFQQQVEMEKFNSQESYILLGDAEMA
jgi:hypothetical protein